MTRPRDEPAFPVVIAQRTSEGTYDEVDCYWGLTGYEHAVIEQAKSITRHFVCPALDDNPQKIAGEAAAVATAIWDALESEGKQ